MLFFKNHSIIDHPFGIKEYCYKNSFSKYEIENIINYLDKNFYEKNVISWDRPGYQTPFEYNILLIDFPEFKKIKDLLFESIKKYVNQKILVDIINSNQYGMNSWCYMDWGSSSREHKFTKVMEHAHNTTCPDTISAIFYLKLPKGRNFETEFHLGGNRFNLPSRELSWFIFPSNYMHTPPKHTHNKKRYVISADIWFPM